VTTALAPGTAVVVGSRLGRIVKDARIGSADGYSITTAIEAHDGSAPHFVAEYAVRVAELGVNVCRARRGECFCGLVHVARPEQLVNSVHMSNDEGADRG
jgi:hypothetical protein